METSGGARLIRLQAALDPGGPLKFQDEEVTDASLNHAIHKAKGWSPDATGEPARYHRWLNGIRRERILGAMAAVVEGDAAERLGIADQRLRTWSRQTLDVLDQIPEKDGRAVAEGAENVSLSFLFAVALGVANPADRHSRALAAVNDRDTADTPWAEDLAVRVLHSTPDDLGLVIPAAAVISVVTTENQNRRVREAAEEASYARRLEEQRQQQEAAARAREAQKRRSRFRRTLVGRLWVLVPSSLVYSAFSGFFLAALHTDPETPSWGQWQASAIPMLVSCGAATILTCLLDWFLDSQPENGTRRVVAWGIGLSIGFSGWINFVAHIPDPDPGMLWIMPWSFCAALMAETTLEWFISRVNSANYPDNEVVRMVNRTSGVRLLLTSLGAIGGIGALIFGSVSASTALSLWETASRATFLYADVFGIGTMPGMVVALAIVSNVCQATAVPLARMRPPLGAAAAVVGPLLGLLVFFAYPLNFVTLLVGMVS